MTALLLAAPALAEDPAVPPAVVPDAADLPDRSRPPAVAPPPVIELPEPEVHPLGPGVEAWFVHVDGLRKVSVEVVFDRGMVELLHAPTMVGRGTGWLADAAAGDLDGAAFSAQCDLHEAEVSSNLGLHDGGVSLTVPREDLADGLRLESLVLRDATYPKKEVKRWILDQRQYYLVDGPASPDALGRSALAYGWFDASHPYGARPDLSQLDRLDGRQLLALWTRARQESPTTVIVVGDVSWGDVEPALRAMTAGLGHEGEPSTGLLVDPPAKTRVIAVDLPGQQQTAIRARLAMPTRDADDQPAMAVANFVLGGHFLSRLNANLREEKGWTYGAYSGYAVGPSWGHETLQVDVLAENTGATLVEIDKELQRLATEPVQPDELEMAHRTLVANWNRTLENADSAAATYWTALDAHQTAAGLRERQEAMVAVTAEQLQQAAARWWSDPSAPVDGAGSRARLWVLVGDRRQIEPQLAELGWTAEWIAPTDVMLGRL